MPKKSKTPRKPLYRRPAPKGEARIQNLGARSGNSDLPHAHLIRSTHFELRDDGSIGAPASGTARSQQTPNAVLEAGAPPLGAAKRSEDGSTLNAQPSTMPPRLAFTDPVRGIWLYHGNSLELLDAIAAKYPDGRFDAIFADPPALP